MGKQVFSFIVKEMKYRKYFSISVESTADVSHTDQLTVTDRCALDSGPIERFYKFLQLTSHQGNDMTDLVSYRIDYCPCAAHSLNSVGESAASCCIESFFVFFLFFDYQ